MSETYDVLVIGGGSAGTAAARTASQAGARTAMFNEGELGGLCILRGCMPTKTLLHSAHLAHHARHPGPSGIEATNPAIDFAQVMRNKAAKVQRFKDAKIQGIERGGYDVIDARARFAGPNRIVAAGRDYTFARGAVIAPGSVPHRPHIPGIDSVAAWNSDDVMALTEQPRSVVVIGTGAIGLELAQFFARIGTTVQVVSRRPVSIDYGSLISEEMMRALRDEPNLTLWSPATPHAVRQNADGRIELEIETASEQKVLTADHLLLATGRGAATDDLDLEAAGVERDSRGQIVFDEAMRTSNPRVFAAGDATGRDQILHVANQEGVAAGHNAAHELASGNPEEHKVDRRLNMEVTFTDPPLANLGETPETARKRGAVPVIATAHFPQTGRAITMDTAHGLWQMSADASSGQILGTQILGPRADDLVHTIAAVMHFRGTPDDLLAMPWYHPTLSEVVLNLARDLREQLQ